MGYIHNITGGLIICENKDGKHSFSNELKSSGGDDSGILLLGLFSFVFSFLWYFLKKTKKKTVYYMNLLFCYFVLFLVNLDVSVIGSIQSGDHILFFILISMHLPVMYHLLKFRRTVHQPVVPEKGKK